MATEQNDVTDHGYCSYCIVRSCSTSRYLLDLVTNLVKTTDLRDYIKPSHVLVVNILTVSKGFNRLNVKGINAEYNYADFEVRYTISPAYIVLYIVVALVGTLAKTMIASIRHPLYKLQLQ